MEGAVQGAIFLCASVATKRYVFAMGGSNNAAAFVAGVVGGVAQAIILTPSTMAFTSLNVNKHKPGYENDNEFTVAKRIYKEKGLGGLFVGADAMAARQASTWASRTLFTELCRTNLQLVSKYGLLGEVASGIMGGLGSCWNTPIETVRVLMHRDMSCGHPTKSFMGYVQQEMDAGGIPALFRGVSPRALQAIWQTVFMVVVPNVLGI
jgi:phage shock protein PspC (stress-responsive transcriptional regulator)